MTTPEITPPAEPPSDPESWSDDQWLTWLRATDADAPDAPPRTLTSRVARSAGGQVLGEAMRGLANAMYGVKDEELVIVSEASGQPHDDETFTVHLDPEHPERSTAVFTGESPDETNSTS